MRISDWSSDVCSSDLRADPIGLPPALHMAGQRLHHFVETPGGHDDGLDRLPARRHLVQAGYVHLAIKIGRASCRERVCPYVSISGVSVSLQKQRITHSTAITSITKTPTTPHHI